MFRISKLIVSLILLNSLTIAFPLFEFKHQASLIPHPQKAHRGGEDAYFASHKLLIVADGVGGWNNYGINPADFSRFLCSKGSKLFNQNQTHYRKNLIQIIAESARTNQNLGSSTMVVVTLDNQHLRTCYIGDSGFAIFRLNQQEEYELAHEFKQQQHGFNFPFQLSRKDLQGDDPYLSICRDFLIQQEDIVVVGSDGLFDNVYVTEILELINFHKHEEQQLFGLSERLAKLAIERGKDNTFWSPFAQRAKEQKISYRGGKLDDTTVIISKITKTKSRNNREIKNEQNEQTAVNQQQIDGGYVPLVEEDDEGYLPLLQQSDDEENVVYDLL